MRLRNFFAAAALVLGLALPGRATDLMITVNGTVSTADAGMGYTVGDPVSFTWVVNDYAPAAPFGTVSAGSFFEWKQENAGTEPSLWANVYGTGIGGTFNEAPGGAPFERLNAHPSAANDFRVYMNTDSFNTTTNNHGIYLAANPSFFIKTLAFQGNINAGFANITSPLPNPTVYLAGYLGTYNVASALEADMEAGDGATALTATFNFSTVTFAQVPEPSTYILGGLAMGVMGVLARRRKAKRLG